jgi:hypothetical protein
MHGAQKVTLWPPLSGLHLPVRLRAGSIYLYALLIFAASRLVVFIGVHFGTLLVPAENPGKWEAGPAWYHRLLRWDTGWYASIARHGYSYDDPAVHNSTVFYPLYPLVAAALKAFAGIDEYLALLIVANAASVAAALLMARFFADELGHETALLSVALFSFFPSSLFLSAGYTESLCLSFILLSFILMRRGKFVTAAVAAGLALATRSAGIVMIPVILWEMWRRDASPGRLPGNLPAGKLALVALCCLLAASGLLIYMVFLGIRFGHPLAFAESQLAWHGGTFTDRLASAATLGPFRHFNWRDGGGFLVFLILTVWSFRQLRPTVSLYALGVLMLPYVTLGITDSMNRFIVMCFPAFMCLGLLCKSRVWLASILIGVFSALLLANTALFSQWYWIG